MVTPDELFDHLLREDEVISYIDAYEALFGERPYLWHDMVHATRVIAEARQSSTRTVGRFRIQLDALIVTQADREPSKGHFRTARYEVADWRRMFGQCGVCRCAP